MLNGNVSEMGFQFWTVCVVLLDMQSIVNVLVKVIKF